MCVRRIYIDFLILLMPTPLVLALFCCTIPTVLFAFVNGFLLLYNYIYNIYIDKQID